ncbi:MAG: hypothetical protein D3916_02125 [Candidatus Electrothrix sp. MAN1_4]|nr:hypothetical protein [Candidatus Electrothrix sp. MAN1_4]
MPNWRLTQRLGPSLDIDRSAMALNRTQLIWIHAASVGEVQAAHALIAVLLDTLPDAEIFLTTMTMQGRAIARSLLPAHVRCELAPLDISPVVDRAIKLIQPDLYICLETEFWPVMLTSLHKAGVPMLLLNGRISQRSFRQYQWIRKTLESLLAGFSTVGVISEQDRERFCHLGVPTDHIQVCGNLKYGLMQPATGHARQEYRQRLGIQHDEIVFFCGSTRTGEEKLLLSVYIRLQEKYADKLLWIIAPRHLERLGEVKALLKQAGLTYELFSQRPRSVERNDKTRQGNIILLDSIGELARLYAVGDYIFCGGSLVNKGGHNIMEPIAQGRPVFFGPFMQDFQDAVDLVLAAGAGVQVASPDELSERLLEYPVDAPAYKRACQRACLAAEQLVQTQQGVAIRQAEMVLRVLDAK